MGGLASLFCWFERDLKRKAAILGRLVSRPWSVTGLEMLPVSNSNKSVNVLGMDSASWIQIQPIQFSKSNLQHVTHAH